MITNLNKNHRIKLAKYWVNLSPENNVFGDEFFIYAKRKINTKNDVIWLCPVRTSQKKLYRTKKLEIQFV